ncbi:MAG: polyribonucleotide nucleotidyltransferase, partial [Desulfobacteraceae bacterium]|nr:polyribonucleotide nucleotidyltransferase [Desulfobacteraceae bacterium]
IPFEGPIAGIRVGRIDGNFVANPTIKQMEESDINLVVAGSKTGIIMVEGGAETVSEEEIIDAIYFGHTAMQPILEMQEELKKALGKEKREIAAPEVDQELFSKIAEIAKEKVHTAVQVKDKMERGKALGQVKEELLASISEEYPEREKEIKGLFKDLVHDVSRDIVLKEGKRIDGRAFDEIRHIACEVGNLPRPHGSALFTRGETQVQGVLTLGSGLDEQRIETLAGQTMRKFMLHYNFPPFSVGECRRAGGPSRRDIGHGNLASRALEQVIPDSEDFEYTIRLVGEVLESNGSSSMGTVCAGTLAMMDGGVPIKAPVSGIAMGLVKEGDNMVVLSDILGDEDHFGDMDFKVAGPEEGITALQMDIKIKELPKEVMVKALTQAKAGRLHILGKMLEALDVAREDISPYAP